MPEAIRWILFDMGNVLVRYAPRPLDAFARHLGVEPADFIAFYEEGGLGRQAWLGQLTPEQLVQLTNRRFGLGISRQAYVDWFAHEIDQVLPGIPELLGTLRKNYRLAVLSNTFFGHWDYWLKTPLARQIDISMASHELGCAKPDPAVYAKALARMGTVPGETVFMDDKEANVAGARAAGIHAFQSRSPEETIEGLRAHGVRV